jgi:membrane protease YdiL (CAAX protease family)
MAVMFNIVEDNKITEAVLDSNKYFALFLTCISAPLCEELIYRGYIYKTLNRFYGFWSSAIISSLIFGIAHLYPLGIFYAFLCGMALSFIYYRYKSLLMCAILHMCINFFTLTVFYNEIDKLHKGQVLFAEFIAFVLIIMITLRMNISSKK